MSKHSAAELSTWTDPKDSEKNIAWTREFWTDMQRFSSGRVYLNFPGFGEEGENLMRATLPIHRLHQQILRLQVATMQRRDLCPSVEQVQQWSQQAKSIE